jgi:hypothetical protein
LWLRAVQAGQGRGECHHHEAHTAIHDHLRCALKAYRGGAPGRADQGEGEGEGECGEGEAIYGQGNTRPSRPWKQADAAMGCALTAHRGGAHGSEHHQGFRGGGGGGGA